MVFVFAAGERKFETRHRQQHDTMVHLTAMGCGYGRAKVLRYQGTINPWHIWRLIQWILQV